MILEISFVSFQLSSSSYDFPRKLTPWVWVDLPVVAERPASDKDGHDGGNKCSNDEQEADVYANAVTSAESILLKRRVLVKLSSKPWV